MRNILFSIPSVYFLWVFVTAVSAVKTSLKFQVIADWGGFPFFPYKTFVELSVGREMAEVASRSGIDAVVAIGDNFYLKGVTDVDDNRFKETFETAFNYTSLNVPWLVVAGNHDHYGNISAQIAYTKKSDRWYFPDLYYLKSYQIPSSNMTLDLLMIDTVVLCGNTDPDHPHAQPIYDAVPKATRDAHWNWLQETLKSSKANYVLVSGHYPVYSIATHGPTDCLVKNLQPLLEKYNVTTYLSGHDHNMQHIHVPGEKVDYIISGAAGFVDPSKENLDKIPPKSLCYHWGNPFSLGAFAYVEIDSSNITTTFLLSNGKTLYSFSKSPRFS